MMFKKTMRVRMRHFIDRLLPPPMTVTIVRKNSHRKYYKSEDAVTSQIIKELDTFKRATVIGKRHQATLFMLLGRRDLPIPLRELIQQEVNINGRIEKVLSGL